MCLQPTQTESKPKFASAKNEMIIKTDKHLKNFHWIWTHSSNFFLYQILIIFFYFSHGSSFFFFFQISGQNIGTTTLIQNSIAPCPLRAPLVVIFVGLPCRGKSLAAHKIARHLCWKGEYAKGICCSIPSFLSLPPHLSSSSFITKFSRNPYPFVSLFVQ